MSNLTVKGNASGTGTVILEAPNTNSNRTITLPDSTSTLATTAYVDTALSGAASVTLLGTIATTSGSSVTLSGLTLTDYKQLSVVCNGVSGTAGGVDYIQINGFNMFYAGFYDAAGVSRGGATIDLASGVFWSAGLGGANLGTGGASGLTTASTSITFTISAGSFDAGSIRIYGVK